MTFRILLQNLRSIHRNFNELDQFINQEKAKPDVIALTETWCNQYTFQNAYQLIEYGQLLRSDREKRGGGVGFFIRKGIKVQIKAITNNEHVQLLTVALLNEKVITVGYKTPNYGIDEYINVCQEHLYKFTIKPESLQVFCGDFNLNVIEQTNKIAKVLDFFSCTGLQIKNRSEPTRVTSCTAICIDIFFANFEVSVNVKDTMISDHRGVELSCKETRVDPEKSKEKFLFRPLKKLQNKELRLDLNYSIAKKLGTRSKLYLSSDLDFSVLRI